jgi:hypothetical protein
MNEAMGEFLPLQNANQLFSGYSFMSGTLCTQHGGAMVSGASIDCRRRPASNWLQRPALRAAAAPERYLAEPNIRRSLAALVRWRFP